MENKNEIFFIYPLVEIATKDILTKNIKLMSKMKLILSIQFVIISIKFVLIFKCNIAVNMTIFNYPLRSLIICLIFFFN